MERTTKFSYILKFSFQYCFLDSLLTDRRKILSEKYLEGGQWRAISRSLSHNSTGLPSRPRSENLLSERGLLARILALCNRRQLAARVHKKSTSTYSVCRLQASREENLHFCERQKLKKKKTEKGKEIEKILSSGK